MIEKLLVFQKRFKDIAEELSKGGYDLEIVYNGKVLLKAGKNAKPSFFGIVGPVEISDIESSMDLLSDLKLL